MKPTTIKDIQDLRDAVGADTQIIVSKDVAESLPLPIHEYHNVLMNRFLEPGTVLKIQGAHCKLPKPT